MNYLLMSVVGCSFFLIPRLSKEKGTEKVYWYCFNTEMTNLGRNMEKMAGWEKLVRTKSPFEVINKADKNNLTIIFEDNGAGALADHLRKAGYKVYGGSEIADKLENDRWFSIQLMRKVMDVPETEYFDTFEEGLAFLKGKGKDEKWVFKPQDIDVPKDKTYVGKDISDLTDAMKKYKEEWQWNEGFVLQKFIDGIEADFNAYFNGKDWVPQSLCWYFENKPFLAGDIGPATGGEIAVAIFRPNEGIAMEILKKLTPMLKKYNYQGQMALNCIFSREDHKPYFLEVTPRNGFPGLDLEITNLEDMGKSFTAILNAVVSGAGQPLFPTKKVAVMCVVSAPPYPLDSGAKEVLTGLPVSWDKAYDEYMFPFNLMYKKGMVLAGNSSHVLHVTCIDDTVDGAVAMLYEKYIPSIRLQNKQYRNDCGKNAKERIKILKDWKVI